LVLLRVFVESYLATAPRKKGEKFLRMAGEALAEEELLASVFQIRPSRQHAAVRRARKEAAAIFERYLPVWLARLPRT
jgi:hypothetical protein